MADDRARRPGRRRRRGRGRVGARRGHPRPVGGPGRGARLRLRHVEPVQQARSTAACATSRCSTSRLVAEALQERGLLICRRWPRTWSGRCRSSTRCSTASGSGSTSAPASRSTTRWACCPATPRGVPHHRHLTRRGALRIVPGAAEGRADRRAPVLRRPGRRRPAHDVPRPHRGGVRRARRQPGPGRRVPARGRAGHRRGRAQDLETGRDFEVRARQVVNATGVWTDDTQALVGERGQFHVRASQGHPPRRAARPDPAPTPG